MKWVLRSGWSTAEWVQLSAHSADCRHSADFGEIDDSCPTCSAARKMNPYAYWRPEERDQVARMVDAIPPERADAKAAYLNGELGEWFRDGAKVMRMAGEDDPDYALDCEDVRSLVLVTVTPAGTS